MYPEDKQKEVPYPMSRKNPFVMPILKWVGGKRQLLDSINPLIPECSTYYEPFIGGGAVLFGRQPNKAVINDSNEELINVYRMIKEEPEELIAALSAHKKQNCEEYYSRQGDVSDADQRRAGSADHLPEQDLLQRPVPRQQLRRVQFSVGQI